MSDTLIHSLWRCRITQPYGEEFVVHNKTTYYLYNLYHTKIRNIYLQYISNRYAYKHIYTCIDTFNFPLYFLQRLSSGSEITAPGSDIGGIQLQWGGNE